MASEVNSKQFHFWTQKSIMCPQNFSQSLHGENLLNASKLHSKFLRFWTHKSRKFAQNLFIYLQAENFPTKSELFYGLLLYIHTVTWERLKSWKCVPHIFQNITKFCVVKFSPVKEIACKFASADFQNFCRLVSKKSAKSAGFVRLRGNTGQVPHKFREIHVSMVKVVSTARRAIAVRCIGCGINGQLQRSYSCRAQPRSTVSPQLNRASAGRTYCGTD